MFKWLSVLIFLSCVSCGKPLPELTGMDLPTWKGDKNACSNKRIGMQNALQHQKEKLLALDEGKIIKLLGKPDQNELYRRNQKFYTYFLSPAPMCASTVTPSKVLIIRFNAMGLAKEVAIE
jgi:hypothetical protein